MKPNIQGVVRILRKKLKFHKESSSRSDLLPQDRWWVDNCIVHNFNNIATELNTNFGELKSMFRTSVFRKKRYYFQMSSFLLIIRDSLIYKYPMKTEI